MVLRHRYTYPGLCILLAPSSTPCSSLAHLRHSNLSLENCFSNVWHKYLAKTGRLRSARALVLINQSKPNERSLDPQQGHAVVGGGDHLLKYLRACFEQAIQFRIVALSASVR